MTAVAYFLGEVSEACICGDLATAGRYYGALEDRRGHLKRPAALKTPVISLLSPRIERAHFNEFTTGACRVARDSDRRDGRR